MLASVSSVSHQLTRLQELGYLSRGAGQPRTAVVRHLTPPPRPGAGPPQITEVPLVGRIAAGIPIFADESVEDVLPLPTQLVGDGDLIMLKVVGDSMIGAAIADGDWVVVRRETDIENGDIVAAIREKVAPDFPVVLRFSQWKNGHYDAQLARNPGELETMLTPMADAGVSAFHASGRRYWQPEFPDSGSDLNIAGWVKKVTDKPVITVGSVGLDGAFEPASASGKGAGVQSIDRLLERLEQNEFDLVAVGRALIADPQWADKILKDRWSELIPYGRESVQSLY